MEEESHLQPIGLLGQAPPSNSPLGYQDILFLVISFFIFSFVYPLLPDLCILECSRNLSLDSVTPIYFSFLIGKSLETEKGREEKEVL